MARIFITGSADGLGHLTAKALVNEGHRVVLHARNKVRGLEALQKIPAAEAVFNADLTNLEETKQLAESLNLSGKFDVIIHNAGVYKDQPENILAVNLIAPYVLTSLIHKPKRIIYLSSSLHLQAAQDIQFFNGTKKGISYEDSKLYVLMLSNYVANKWRDVYVNAVDPGWVPTKMGGKNATDDLQKGYETQFWLAISNDAKALVSSKYFYHKKEKKINPSACDKFLQEELITLCAKISGVDFF